MNATTKVTRIVRKNKKRTKLINFFRAERNRFKVSMICFLFSKVSSFGLKLCINYNVTFYTIVDPFILFIVQSNFCAKVRMIFDDDDFRREKRFQSNQCFMASGIENLNIEKILQWQPEMYWDISVSMPVIASKFYNLNNLKIRYILLYKASTS